MIASARIAYWEKKYHPIDNGVHVCGVSYERDQSGEFCTVANFPHSDPRALFGAFREYATTSGEGDVVVDLVIDGDTVDDFWARRQSVELMQRAFASRIIA
jgi:hypothetical protein